MEKKGTTGATPQDVERCNKALEEAFALSQKMTALTPENKWTLDGTKEGVTVHYTYDPSGLAMSRGEGVVDVPAEDLAEYLFDEKYLGEYDSSLEVNEALAKIDEKTTVAWELTKKITFISQRDFLYVCRIYEKDGSIYLIARSIDWPAKPPASGHVRAELRLVAWILTPLKDKPNSCHTVHIVSVDLKGSIPSAIVSRETLKQGYVTIKVRETAGAWLKKRGPRKIIVQEKKPAVEEKKPETVTETKKDECCAEKKECTEKKDACCAEEKKETVEKKDACCAEKTEKKECTEKKDECCAEEKKETAEKKECTEKKDACCAEKTEKKEECTEKKEKDTCCSEKKECCAEEKECCDKGKECTEKKECCDADGECKDQKKEAEEPKKETVQA